MATRTILPHREVHAVDTVCVAIAIGRGVRYLALGLLAVQYGGRAMVYMREHGTVVSLVVVGILAAAFLAYLFWTKVRSRKDVY